ncbi:TonB-dependent receptor [Cognatilysobacter lacus]|uniref:Oar protein n=1 Tax=Cognatilysobacter lacus TaxID=1643323 RepID=A0A5D8ZA62_9GAMM|nr:TonB-dependent receptor [Lysobacter lacus]TZF91825.1 Oar protein [Lysobacter lacus]
MTHTSRLRLSKLTLGLFAALAASTAFAQSTSAGLNGVVTDAGGRPVAGADVTIVHVESGTVSHATTDANGRYNARGLRVGGPYTITINQAGAGTGRQEGVYLGLDQVADVDLHLAQTDVQLGSVVVKGKATSQYFGADMKGLSTNLSRRDLDRMPAPDRSIQNVVRADPRIVITDRDRGAFSAAGQNFRYNSITVDTIQAGDPFGLNDNGLPTKGTPISQDAIESYNISTANFDVATRRGVGAWVNAVTKSGTNDFHGSVYYVYQNADKMIGENQSGAKWTGFTKDTTIGATLGGPIVKDKLFFFASYEEGKKSGPGAPYGPSDSNATLKVPGVTQAQLDAIIAAAKAKGLTPGDLTASNIDTDSKRGLVKFDWNINEQHRASLRLSETKEIEPIVTNATTSGANPRLPLSSNWYVLDKKNTSYALSLYDDWTSNFSTEASIGYNEFTQNRAPLVGGPQPEITIRTGVNPVTGVPLDGTGPGVTFGTEFSTQANRLAVKTWNGYFAGTWYAGDHVLKGGFDYQRDDFYNLFLQNYYGSYEFNSLADFNSGNYRRYRVALPAPGYALGNVAAEFRMTQYGLFLQDTWQVNDRLSVQYGVRYDLPYVDPAPTLNPCFAAAPGAQGAQGSPAVCYLRSNTAPGNTASATGGYGYPNTGTIDGNGVVQPRASFNFSIDENTQLRGGAGLFVSNTPAVWVANPYSNNGVAVASYDVNHSGPRVTGDPVFSIDPFNQGVPGGTRTLPGQGTSQMNVSVVDPDFQMPSVAKYTIGIDHTFPLFGGTVASAELQHIDVVKGIKYDNLNLGAPTGTLPDGRLSYAKTPNAAPGGANTNRWNANPSFGQQVILLTNTDKGQSDSLTLSLRRPFSNNWAASLAYTFTRATDVNPGASSVANSSFQNRSWINPNDDELGTSNYQIPNRVLAQVTWQHKFFGSYATSMSALYDGHNGAPYSWIFGNDVNGDSYFRDLAYIPAGPQDVQFATGTTEAAKQSFFDYIASNPELARYRGKIFDRNEDRAPWVNQLDLTFSQEIPGFMKGHKGEVRLDIFNVLNMLNKDWGVEYRASFPLERVLADEAGVQNGKYVYDISRYLVNGVYSPQALRPNESQTPSQRWSALLTLRYKF